ncbi:MAG: hypothetical protein C0412_09500 [Flavobacterium sp.]|nr:hypothetical protein [Flavobacterium sp.]
MRILFDIGHPAHVHYFKNIIYYFKNNKHDVIITAREKDVTFELLRNYNLDFISRGKGSDSFLGKLAYLVYTDIKLIKLLRKEPPDIFIGFGSPYASHTASVLGKPSIILDDTENAKIGQFFYKPFASVILSPTTFLPDFGDKHIKFNSFMELAYLHKNHYQPSNEILEKLEINNDDKICLLRFVSWKANHDLGHKGISLANKIKIVKEFSKYSKVFISSEQPLPSELEKYRLKVSPELVHDVISTSTLLFGESATMASEAAVLGTPAVYLDNVGRGYTKEQQSKYGLVYNFTESLSDQTLAMQKGIEILKNFDSKRIATERSNKMCSEKIDVTSFLIWFVENYPESKNIINENPDYQYNFF